MTNKYKVTIKPLSKFDKRGDVANEQFYLRLNSKGEFSRLYIVYDDDHDDENEDGSHPLHDVTDQYEVTIIKILPTPSPNIKELANGLLELVKADVESLILTTTNDVKIRVSFEVVEEEGQNTKEPKKG